MPNNPVQIVLNSQDFVLRSEINPGGQNKDFFEGRNAEFVQHRERLTAQIAAIGELFQGAPGQDVIYAKVELQTAAWAKSHRPTQKIFPPKSQVYVGGAEIGSMVVELVSTDIPRIVAAVEAAEGTVAVNSERKPKPSRSRSEVGAIHSIRAVGMEDRRRFSINQAAEWLADPRTGGAYYVETFVSPKSIELRNSDFLKARGNRALQKFEENLHKLKLRLEISRVSDEWTSASIYIIKLLEDVTTDRNKAIEIHTALLNFLDKENVVKAILLPPVLQSARAEGDRSAMPDIQPPVVDQSYPTIGIVDAGVSLFPQLNAWSAGSCDFIDVTKQDVGHGTFIAGLLCGGDVMNAHPIFQEEKCKYFDLGLHPTGNGYGNYYPRGFIDFLEQLDAEIPAAKERGARIFNMSLAVTTPVSDDGYSLFANILDEIADKHDILFVLPAGNLNEPLVRDEWPANPNDAMTMLAAYQHAGQDRIYQPADSIRSIVVGALDPQLEDGKYRPTRYTRRGPGPAHGAKPDLAHIGGRFHANSGLCSISPDGGGVQSCGTSYASPLVAKTVAAVDHAIEGNISRDALIALVIHHATIPAGLELPKLKPVVKEFIGAGLPRPAAETLLTEDSGITLVFNGVIHNGHELNFQFAWPASLVSPPGGCSGRVKLTIVYRPPVDRNYGAEFVRINLDAFLRQEVVDTETGEVKFEGRLKGEGSKRMEKELVRHAAKWWPVKVLKDTFDEIGNSSQWRLVIKPLARSAFVMPEGGIPFCAVLTIEDENGERPVFNEMRLQLQTSGANISDIRTALRPRIR